MPSALLYLGIMLITIAIWFALFKRPMYEAIFISFILLLFITNRWSHVWQYINTGLSTSLLFSMISFLAMSILLTETKIIDCCIAVILSLLGRIRGGAGYVSVLASAFMGALSGSGPGNVMATGMLTIPAMKHSGFPPELAANIESTASCMGNMIPPSSNIVAAFGAFLALYPNYDITMGQFWVVLWGISLWFILQRIVTVYAFCRYYKVKPMAKEDLPDLKQVLREGWPSLLLPVVILLPFVLEYLFETTLPQRIGETGAKYFTNSLLLFTPGVAAIYTCFITKDKKLVTPKGIAKMFADNVTVLVPAVGVCLIGYMIGGLFADLNVAAEIETFVLAAKFSKFGMVLFLSLLSCVLGMVIPGSSLVVIFGTVFISAFVSVGVDPLLAAAMLPCICGVMCGMTPPLGLGMYAGMSIAESDFGKTFRNNLWWVALQFALEVVVLMGWLPILGM